MPEPGDLSGLLVVDKPDGCTSHDVVDRVRKVFRTSRVGHSGTLDPAATGVLLVGIGKATRLLSFLQNLPKTYRASVRFGVSTDTGDAEGEETQRHESAVTLEQVRAVADDFWGETEQIPPMVSAVKVGGERLYKAARRGEVVEREPRKVRIYQIEVEEFRAGEQVAQIYVRCSSGTYIRTLATDIGDRLGVGAHLRALRRLSIGSFDVSESVALSDLEGMGDQGASERVLSMAEAMRDFPQVTVEGERLEHVGHGRPLPDAGRAPSGLQSAATGSGPLPPGRTGNIPLGSGIPKPAGGTGGIFGGRLMPQRRGELPVLAQPRSGDRPAHESGMTAGIPVAILNPDGDLIAVYRRSARELKPAAVFV